MRAACSSGPNSPSPQIPVMRRSILAIAVSSTLAVSCKQHGPESLRAGDSSFTRLGSRLPTGVRLDPAATLAPIGPMALTMRLTPERNRVAVSLGGYAKQGVQIIDVATGQVVQELEQASAFVGLVFSPDGRTLYSSGGNGDVIYRYDWRDGRAGPRDSIRLGARRPRDPNPYPAGIGASPDGHYLFVAENLTDSLAVVDLQTGTVVQRLATERYPYDVVVDAHGTVYVSAWGGNTVSTFATAPGGLLRDAGRIPVARHPSALLLSGDGSRLFVASGSTDQVAVLDTKARRVVARLLDPPPAGPGEGSTPNALALSSDGTRLFVAEADANAIAVFNLSPAASGVIAASGDDKLAGRIPAGWYPSSLLVVGDQLEVASGKGRGSIPNPHGPNPQIGRTDEYSLNTIAGAVMRVPLSETSGDALARFTARVASANGWTPGSTRPSYPPFEHVIYIVKENRTYDQVFGDDAQGDGDTSLVFFPRAISREPSLARRSVRAVRPLLRERRSEPRRPQLVDGGVRDGLSRENGAVQLLGTRPLVRLRGHEPRAHSGRRRRRAGERLPVEPRGEEGHHVSQLRRVRGSVAQRVARRSPGGLPRQQAVPARAHESALPRVRPRDQGPASR